MLELSTSGSVPAQRCSQGHTSGWSLQIVQPANQAGRQDMPTGAASGVRCKPGRTQGGETHVASTLPGNPGRLGRPYVDPMSDYNAPPLPTASPKEPMRRGAGIGGERSWSGYFDTATHHGAQAVIAQAWIMLGTTSYWGKKKKTPSQLGNKDIIMNE